MSNEQPTRRTFELKLTPRQREEIRALTGKEAESLTLTEEELEERIAPISWGGN